MTRIKSTYLALIAVLLSPMAANADIITWTLNDFVFDDGATAAGYFKWDNVSESVIAWNIDVLPTIPGRNDPSPGTYSDSTGAASSFASSMFFSEGALWQFRIGVDTSALSTAVDVLSLGVLGTFNGRDYSYVECENCAPFRLGGIDDAYLSAAVPEPGSLALLGIGLAALGLSRRRKSA